MDSKKIEELLNRYWDCETSLEEEAQLREYFQGGAVPEEHKEAAALFQYFHASRNQPVPEVTLDASRLQEHRPKGKWVQLVGYTLKIAAGLAVLVIATWFIRNEIQERNIAQNKAQDEEVRLAFEETKKALMMISANFGKAEQEAKKINLFNEAQEQIQKAPDHQ
jgi:uncharacterized protein HemX